MTDLNRLRDIILEQQRRKEPYSPDPERQITVKPTGEIQVGPTEQSDPVSRVHMGTFAGLDQRTRRDMETAGRKLPPGTVFINEPEVRGWSYTVDTDFGETYTLFAYFDGVNYQVRLVSPPLEGRYNPHGAHLYPDGRLCLSQDRGSGQPSLEEAFSKSVLWAEGMGFVKAGHPFPFSQNTAE